MCLAFLPNLSGSDGILILLIVMLLFGARKFPDLAKGMEEAIMRFTGNRDEERDGHGKIDWLILTFLFINVILFSLILFYGKS